ncbi:protein EVI2B isoform X1 [Dipodomys spectabilis]|uniref:protein EVI2B isoform X1 n=1 Tax=Dipodomys spectabilis TaxID=105255 RepID=UPI001C53D3C9|nr:protein EVI2B isoform X1 [Dipodomys spectabilis]
MYLSHFCGFLFFLLTAIDKLPLFYRNHFSVLEEHFNLNWTTLLPFLAKSPNDLLQQEFTILQKKLAETKAIPEKEPQSALITSSVPYISTNSQNTTGNALDQLTQFNNISSGQPISPAKINAEQPTPAIYVSSGKPAAHTSGQPDNNIISLPIPTINTSFLQTAPPVFTSARQLPHSPHTSTPSQQSPLLVYNSSKTPVVPTVHNLSIQPTPTVYLPKTINVPRNTPVFTSKPTSNKRIPHKTNYNAIAAILIGIILISMLVAILMIILWKCLRKPVLRDQNWAGRSPFADGETPDICMDNIRENEISTKHTSIVSLMTWKPNKSTHIVDDLAAKLFESSENIGDAINSKTDKIKEPGTGTSEDSADRSTIGTAVSSSDDADLPLPPPHFVDVEGQDKNQSDKPPITASSCSNDSTYLQPSLDSLNQASEDDNSENKQPFPSHSDLLNLPLPPDFTKSQEDFNNEIQCQEFSILPASDQDLTESLPLPPPPEELL